MYVTLDIDECMDPSSCHHLCTNNEGSFVCSCYDGYILNSDQRSCVCKLSGCFVNVAFVYVQ